MATVNVLSQELRKLAEGFMRQSMKGMLAFARERNLSLPQINVLMHLHYKEKCSVSDIAKNLGISNAAASQLVKKLEQERLVQRHEGIIDRRIRQIKLADNGRRIVESLIESRFQWLDAFSLLINSKKADQILLSVSELTEVISRIA